MPAAIPPHKSDTKLSDSSSRLAMVQLAIEDNPSFEASDMEIGRGGISYTIDTVRALRQEYKLLTRELFLIMGSDNLEQITTWREPARIFEECQVVVIARPHHSVDAGPTEFARRAMVVRVPQVDISASQIRDRVRMGKSIRYLVPKTVEEFIIERRLYRE
jgi:nicotinate-nucleotide adenylyltransferase